MSLMLGLNRYQNDAHYARFTLPLEEEGRAVVDLLREHGGNPSVPMLAAARRFLIEVESWKAMCLQERMGSASRNGDSEVWEALLGAVSVRSDREALLSVMQLTGFGVSEDQETGQRRAKVATAVLRFLLPEQWGVVDWRNAAILGLFREHGDALALEIAKGVPEAERKAWKKAYDIIDEDGACAYNGEYRSISSAYPGLPRAADVDMALFGVSLLAWPLQRK